MPPIALAGVYLTTTILCVDLVYRMGLALRTRLAGGALAGGGAVTYFLGLLPPVAGLTIAAVYALSIPALRLASASPDGAAISGAMSGVIIGSLCSLIAVGCCAAFGLIRSSIAPRQELGHRTVTLSLVALDLLISAAFEEVVFRGQLLQCLLRVWNQPAAIVVSSVVFALVHAWKQRDAPWLWVLNTALFGLLAAELVLATGTLAAPIALHFVWNVVETPILGLPANGSPYNHGLLVSQVDGPGLLTGGEWSLDAGLVSTAALVAGLALVAMMA